ncbi:hypothetical protein KM1_325380 [Entamoeba histolytica HM-3:IMSS]|uniref:Uncharacterized protein n=3 Tax=Entamoeba histolytica TaxID=5759 RepID=B1N4G9_ENTH1|nr:hypothetical protein EHI_003030 [Entamoeba histolytica HM-1:IMSS]XP_652553.1 hypothetical protein EHI_008700 [Entamoeba histolytica HM-1:IMSS]EMS11984.1 hypothetical protein KM1_325380 [Entamoeba histolytica HM-3:IMSS]GAT94730.1 hypothetical protein CL6EHI_008700 [Entamoeba histolytica]EAL47165.1 hypothetical protein EHI_008700 [Entamoeba histolytica HM-1:IMSS]EDS89139.1 hypothetical protein EHI_003030 [Entamoeba histolytica HM-1:IMSS]GAT98368.1 hypothetical protein CL6EHI_003030 [Entamoeb|eukprot:XP_001914085.1 hypothetical protein EHI_003030 [Entamoeba histolytica HM-1:IMSS]
MGEVVKRTERSEILKERKRSSRNDETINFDAMIYLLVKEGYEVIVKRSKKTSKTIKMLLPESISKNGNVLKVQDICLLSNTLLNTLGYTRIDSERIKEMTKKQAKRTQEAQINNGVISLLVNEGYTFSEKKVKTAHLTERLIRITSVCKDGEIFGRDELIEMGKLTLRLMEQHQTDTLIQFNQNTLFNSPSSFLSFTNLPLSSSNVILPPTQPINLNYLHDIPYFNLLNYDYSYDNTDLIPFYSFLPF